MLLPKISYFFRRVYVNGRIAVALSKAAAAAPLRVIDETNPLSWEFGAFSQNGEDGIIEFLSRKILRPNRYFVEVGAANGFENNTAWLAIARKFNGLMIEGEKSSVNCAREVMRTYNLGVNCVRSFVTRENVGELLERSAHRNPDVFSIDIDGNDYHVFEALLAKGFRPRIAVVEYNSTFGPERQVTIPYQPSFSHRRAHPSELYYGASIQAWKSLLARHNYAFVSVENYGVNAFFIDKESFSADFVGRLKGVDFLENWTEKTRFKNEHAGRFQVIGHLPLVTVGPPL
jgi:hypothetical protein